MDKSFFQPLIIALLVLFLIAPLSFDLGPLPITMQSFVIISLAALLKRDIILLALLVYLIAGALGLPVYGGFTHGWEKLFGPTAGFLWGFLLVGLFVNYEAEHKEMHLFNAMVLAFKAHFLLLIPGFLVLYFSLAGVDLWATFTRLIPGLIIKSIFAGIVISKTRSYFSAQE
ncbi:MAG: hypothetical protein DA405_09325 [Bacteroidetes bacterium]|nr:MAG: hypothetical protein DA405_09325 [Bacteroidota bacterium]